MEISKHKSSSRTIARLKANRAGKAQYLWMHPGGSYWVTEYPPAEGVPYELVESYETLFAREIQEGREMQVDDAVRIYKACLEWFARHTKNDAGAEAWNSRLTVAYFCLFTYAPSQLMRIAHPVYQTEQGGFAPTYR